MRLSFSTCRQSATDVRVASPRRPASVRLKVEPLEDRTVPSFVGPVTSPGGGGSLSVADLNHDGRADVAVITGKSSVSVRLSNGDGRFQQTAILKDTGRSLFAIDLADWNGDGDLDVIAKSAGKLISKTRDPWYPIWWYKGAVTVSVWLGNGDGTFAGATRLQSTWTAASWPPPVFKPESAGGDFNQDGIHDYARPATQDGIGVVMLWLGNGDGTYQAPRLYAAGPEPGAIAAGDIDGDGWVDLIVVNSLSSANPTLSVLFNDGNW